MTHGLARRPRQAIVWRCLRHRTEARGATAISREAPELTSLLHAHTQRVAAFSSLCAQQIRCGSCKAATLRVSQTTCIDLNSHGGRGRGQEWSRPPKPQARLGPWTRLDSTRPSTHDTSHPPGPKKGTKDRNLIILRVVSTLGCPQAHLTTLPPLVPGYPPDPFALLLLGVRRVRPSSSRACVQFPHW